MNPAPILSNPWPHDLNPTDVPFLQRTRTILERQGLFDTPAMFNTLIAADGFEFIALRDDAIDLILVSPETKARFVSLASDVDRLFKAILPDPAANTYGPTRAVLINLVLKLRSLTPPADISDVMGQVESLLDESVAAKAYVIRAVEEDDGSHIVDISNLDFEKLAEEFVKSPRKRTEAQKLQAAASRRAAEMVRQNPTRIDYLERLRALIDEYNNGSINVGVLFRRLTEFTKELNEEEQRAVAENLDEEQLAVFDLLARPELDLTDKERAQVKKVAEELLEVLKQEKLVLDWRRKQQTRAAVRVTVREVLDRLPDSFSADLWQKKVDTVYQHIFDSYYGEGRSVYTSVAA